MRRIAVLLTALFCLCSCASTHAARSTSELAVARVVPSVAVRANASLSTGPYGFGGLRVRFEHSLICDNGILIASFARTYRISTIYVQLGGDDVSSLINRNPTTVKNLQAMIAVAKVYVVLGSTDWLATPSTVPDDAAKGATVAKAYPLIAGVLYDVDPVELATWDSSERRTLAQDYVTLVATLLAMPEAQAFKSTQVVANVQLATVHAGGDPRAPTILQEIQALPGLGAIQLAVPGNTTASQLQNAAASLAQLTSPFFIVASTSKYAPNSYNGATKYALAENLQDLVAETYARNAAFDGIVVDGWNDLYNSIQGVLPQPAVYTGVLANGPLAPPRHSIYLGAFVNPAGTGASIAQTAALEARIGRTFAYNLHFYQWTDSFPGNAEADDAARGRLPLIAWNCGDTDANVANGADDALIAAHADALKAFGRPVMLRWFWEMNLDDTNDPPRTQCWDPKSDLADGYFAPEKYIAAWEHIRAVFASRGATNVIWEWCVANSHGGPAQYYPGDDQTDWVAMDDYDTDDVSLERTIFNQANELSQFQEKPFMLTETGAHAGVQAPYLYRAVATLAGMFPWIRAIGYFDATGTARAWALDPAGLGALSDIARDPYLSAMPGE